VQASLDPKAGALSLAACRPAGLAGLTGAGRWVRASPGLFTTGFYFTKSPVSQFGGAPVAGAPSDGASGCCRSAAEGVGKQGKPLCKACLGTLEMPVAEHRRPSSF